MPDDPDFELKGSTIISPVSHLQTMQFLDEPIQLN